MISTTGQRPISSAIDKYFIDSNVLIYSYDSADPYKQSVAAALVADILRHGNGAVSVQVLGEFFNSITRRIANPLSVEEAGRAVEAISSSPTLDVLNIDLPMVRRAIATHGHYGTTYWDSLIIAAAERAGCAAILSEDFNTGQRYHGILAINPFVAQSP